jgi:phosphoribosylformylglycinamidine synthase
MEAAVLVFPGSNREHDVARALTRASGRKAKLVWHADTVLPAGTDLVVLPGGFSYGDYLRCGAIAARAAIMPAVAAHAAAGGLVLGICNGFQILCEAGLLPGVLMRNKDRRFACKIVHLAVERTDTAFTAGYRPGQVIAVPCAHGEGNYVADVDTLARLEGEGRVAFRYVTADGQRDASANHNGSVNAIAGIYSDRLNVMGLMPHPENAIEAATGGVDGAPLFSGLAKAVEGLARGAA